MLLLGCQQLELRQLEGDGKRLLLALRSVRLYGHLFHQKYEVVAVRASGTALQHEVAPLVKA